MSPKERNGDTKPPADKVAGLERQAAEAQKKLADVEHDADEAVEHAAQELRDLTVEQEATAERLRWEVQEPTRPVLPEVPKSEEDEGER